MDIVSLNLQNLGRFKDLTIQLAPTDKVRGKVTVLIGSNGAGKTSILKALATNLSWFVARLRNENGKGSSFPEEVVNTASSSALSTLKVCTSCTSSFTWSLAKTLQGKQASFTSDLAQATNLANHYRQQLTDNDQASLGEKSLMALVGDIARRLAMMNPSLENPLEGDGLVLIDKIDLHLHPQWQRNIIQRLTSTFPNCQFVLTTHSPLVISDSKDVLVYSLEDGELHQETSEENVELIKARLLLRRQELLSEAN